MIHKLPRIIRFGLVGVVGLCVDVSVLYAMQALGLGPYVGRLISFLCAASTTWMGNKLFTFRDRSETAQPARQWLTFVLVCACGFAINYGTYVLLVHYVPFIKDHLYLAVAAGSIAGMFFNFSGASKLVFPRA